MPTFGNTSIGSLTGFEEPNAVSAAGTFTLMEDGNVESISLYCAALSGTTNVKCALYTAGLALLGVTDAILVDTSWAWRTFPFPTPITCPAGSYYLAWNSQSVRVYTRYETGGNRWVQYYTYNGFPDPYAPTVWHDELVSIYATYTPLAKPKGTIAFHAKLANII
jgi:hypothetical protein